MANEVHSYMLGCISVQCTDEAKHRDVQLDLAALIKVIRTRGPQSTYTLYNSSKAISKSCLHLPLVGTGVVVRWLIYDVTAA